MLQSKIMFEKVNTKLKMKRIILLIYCCFSLGSTIIAQPLTDSPKTYQVPASTENYAENVFRNGEFPIRGWESQIDDFWCSWMGGDPDWFRNTHYLDYLRDALKRAPQYHINTFMLMGRGDHGELHTFINYKGWSKLSLIQSDEQKSKASEQAKILQDLSVQAKKSGIGIFLWDHEFQLPENFASLYPAAKGVGTAICPSSPLVWQLLADKYNEFFNTVPGISGIVLVFGESKLNILQGSECQCDLCRGKPGSYFVEKIIRTASEACIKYNKQLFVRDFGHSYKEIETVLDAMHEIDLKIPFTAMSKMVPLDFFGLQLPPDPSTTSLKGRPRILEDVVGGEFRGKTHIIVLPDNYYAKHLRFAEQNGGSGAVFRLDHSGYPRSVFDSPDEFNVWLTARLLENPKQNLDTLWMQWASNRYGTKAAPLVVKALKHTDDIWEHSTNSFGFYSTSAHGNIAPFFRGLYNAYSALWDVGDIRARSSPEMVKKFHELLNPTRATINEVVNERKEAVQLAQQSLSYLQKAKPYLNFQSYQELEHYLQLELYAARLWCQLGDMFFSGLMILKSESFPKDIVQRLYNSSESALIIGHQLVERFGRGWPVQPDDGRGTTLEKATSGLWGELLDRVLQIPVQPYFWQNPPANPFTWDKNRVPRSDAERLYLGILEAASGLGTQEVTLEGELQIGKMEFKDKSMTVTAANGHELSLPTGFTVKELLLQGNTPYKVKIRKTDKDVQVEVLKQN
jgi:hypothetical protein